MDVRVGLWRRLSTEELMLLNCGVGEDSWESLGLQGDPTSPFWRRSALEFLWREWCWSWNSNTLATSCEELTHWKRLWCWEGLDAGREEDDRGWDGWMASLTQWMWVWVNSGSWWWTGRPGVLQFMRSQRVGHDWVTQLNWTEWWNSRKRNQENNFICSQSKGIKYVGNTLFYFPAGNSGKGSVCQRRKQKDVGSIPALERPLGGGRGNPLQYSCLEKLIDYSRQESLRRHGVALTVNKSVQNTEIRAQSQEWQNDLSFLPRQTIQHHSNPSLCPTTNVEEAEGKWFYEHLQDLLELTPKTDVLFIIGDWNAKVGSQDILE